MYLNRQFVFLSDKLKIFHTFKYVKEYLLFKLAVSRSYYIMYLSVIGNVAEKHQKHINLH